MRARGPRLRPGPEKVLADARAFDDDTGYTYVYLGEPHCGHLLTSLLGELKSHLEAIGLA
jgi:hypothetical protein